MRKTMLGSGGSRGIGRATALLAAKAGWQVVLTYRTLEEAIAADKIERYHFTLLRNLYEKTSNFLGYPRWSELLPGDQQLYLNRIIQFTSHSTLSSAAIAEPSPQEKQTVKLLLDHLRNNYSYWQEEAPNA